MHTRSAHHRNAAGEKCEGNFFCCRNEQSSGCAISLADSLHWMGACIGCLRMSEHSSTQTQCDALRFGVIHPSIQMDGQRGEPFFLSFLREGVLVIECCLDGETGEILPSTRALLSSSCVHKQILERRMSGRRGKAGMHGRKNTSRIALCNCGI